MIRPDRTSDRIECKQCGGEFTPTAKQVADHRRTCQPCVNSRARDNYRKRLGQPPAPRRPDAPLLRIALADGSIVTKPDVPNAASLIAWGGYWIDAENGRVYGPRGIMNKRTNGHGYRSLRVGSCPAKRFSEHRVIWEAVHGPIPAGMEINHINSIRDDNRIANLELVTPEQNRAHARVYGFANKRGRECRLTAALAACGGAQ